MTTGSIISDDRYNVDIGGGILYPAGEYYQKSWSGGDRTDPEDLTPHNYVVQAFNSYNGEFDYQPFYPEPYSTHETVVNLYGWGSPPALSWSDNDSLKLAVKLGSKIRSHDFNAAIFLAEADQSLALIGQTATRIAKSFHALKSGRIRRAAGYLAPDEKIYDRLVSTLKKHFKHKSAFDDRKVLADAILEIQYGWRPLLSDAATAGQAVASLLSRPVRSTYCARRQIQKNAISTFGPLNNRKYWLSRKTISQMLRATVSAPPSWRSELRLNNFAQAVTNRTPWAFVANWFLPFEDYLEARSTFTDLNISRLLLTQKIVERADFRSSDGGEAWTRSFVFSREVQPIAELGPTSFANTFVPLPSVKPIEKSLGWEHVLNGIALLNGVERRYRD